MKKLVLGLVLVLAVLAVTVTPGYTGGHWRGGVFIGVGPFWGWGDPWYYPPPPYHYYPRPQRPPPTTPPPAPPAPPAAAAYWYYCPSAKAYYPSVPSCAEEWVKVPERR